MKIEIPKESDFERVNYLARQVHDLHSNWRPDVFISVDDVILQNRFIELIDNKNIYVAKIDDIIVGYITISIKEKEVHGMHYRKVLEIDAVCIDEKYRSNGIGTALIEHVINLGKKESCTDLYLSVYEDNIDAIRLYERIGMKVRNINYSMKI